LHHGSDGTECIAFKAVIYENEGSLFCPGRLSFGYQVPPGQVKIRSAAAVVIYSFITLGVYHLYWIYQVFRELKETTREGIGPVVGLIIGILVGFVNWFVLPAEIGDMYEREGKAKPVSGLTGFWNFIPLVGTIIWIASGWQGWGLLMLTFVLASGITIVQVVANPLISLLGPPSTAHSRLTFAQAFNSLGTTVFPYVGSILILGSLATIDQRTLNAAALEAYRAADA